MSDLLWWNLLVIIIDVILFSVFDTVEQYAPGFKQSIVGTDILTPPDLEEVFNLTGGVSWNCYRPQRSCGKVMFSQASVILFTGGGGGGPCVLRTRHPLGTHARAVRILLECNLVGFCLHTCLSTAVDS